MDLRIKRKANVTKPETTVGSGEPILAQRTIGGTTHDAIYISGNSATTNSPDWKGVSMTSFTPIYETDSQSNVSPFSQYILWFGTQADYDALTTKDDLTFYFITE